MGWNAIHLATEILRFAQDDMMAKHVVMGAKHVRLEDYQLWLFKSIISPCEGQREVINGRCV